MIELAWASFSRYDSRPSQSEIDDELEAVDAVGGRAPVMGLVTPYGKSGVAEVSVDCGNGDNGWAEIEHGSGGAPTDGSRLTSTGHQPVGSLPCPSLSFGGCSCCCCSSPVDVVAGLRKA